MQRESRSRTPKGQLGEGGPAPAQAAHGGHSSTSAHLLSPACGTRVGTCPQTPHWQSGCPGLGGEGTAWLLREFWAPQNAAGWKEAEKTGGPHSGEASSATWVCGLPLPRAALREHSTEHGSISPFLPTLVGRPLHHQGGCAEAERWAQRRACDLGCVCLPDLHAPGKT